MLFVYNCYIFLVISFLLFKVDCFYQGSHTARTCKYKVLWSKGFGNNDNKGKKNDDNEKNNQKDGKNGNKKDEDMLLQIIAEKEAEFQAEIDKLLKESRENRGINPNEADDPFEEFSNEDLAKAIIEMQKLTGGIKPEFNESDYQIKRFTVPNGYSGGDTITVEWKGAFFEIDIPEGFTEGDEVEIELPVQV